MIGFNLEQIKLESDKTIESLFKQAIIIEKTAGSIYEKFGQLFSHVPDVSAFWYEMAKEEILHAKHLEEMQNNLTEYQNSAVVDREISEAVKRVVKMISIDCVENIDDLNDAFLFAYELESSEVNAIFQFLTTEYTDSSTRKDFVNKEIKDHIDKFIMFKNNYGDEDMKKMIIADN